MTNVERVQHLIDQYHRGMMTELELFYQIELLSTHVLNDLISEKRAS